MRTAILAAVLGLMISAEILAAEDSTDEAGARILVTFADPAMTNAARPGPSGPGYRRRSGVYLVSLPVKRAATRLAEDFHLSMVDEWPIVPLRVYCQVYAVREDVAVDELLSELRSRPEVESAQLLNRFEVSGAAAESSADPYLDLQHNLETLELGQAHAWSRGDGVDIAVVDTGADVNHPDLVAQIREFEDFVEGSGEFAGDAHGTAVAGVIAASAGNGFGIVGVAPSARLSILKACWYVDNRERAVCDSFTLAKALGHAIEAEVDVINLSLGGPSDPLLARLVDVALDRGIAVVAAAPVTGPAGFPADVPGVIVVGQDLVDDRAAYPAELSAPGTEILVPVPGGSFDYASGTSLSAAQVSGIVALLMARDHRMPPAEAMNILKHSRMQKAHTVNACRALAELLETSGCRESATPATAGRD